MNLFIRKCLKTGPVTTTKGLGMTNPKAMTTNNPALTGRRGLLVVPGLAGLEVVKWDG